MELINLLKIATKPVMLNFEQVTDGFHVVVTYADGTIESATNDGGVESVYPFQNIEEFKKYYHYSETQFKNLFWIDEELTEFVQEFSDISSIHLANL